jgi:serine O-acetyltransferase
MLNPVTHYRLARWLYLHSVPILPRIICRISQLFFHCHLPYTADIGRGFEVGYHGVGVVVHARARIGSHVFIGPGAIVGGRSQQEDVPVVGKNVYIAAGAKVLGNITIGDGAVIGANAVVIESVPARAVAVGVPARIVKEDVDSTALTGWPPVNR